MARDAVGCTMALLLVLYFVNTMVMYAWQRRENGAALVLHGSAVQDELVCLAPTHTHAVWCEPLR
jgi:hypothetical protein